MGYKSVITTWKKIQDWVLELLAGMGIGSAYKYDSQTGKATIEANSEVETKTNGTAKTQSAGFAWINSLGQWIINLGTNIAETWGILGNYRFGQDAGGNGTWNGIFQKDTQGNNLEVLHSDVDITQLAVGGNNRVVLKGEGTYLVSPYANHVDQTAIYLGELIFNIGNIQYNNLYNGLGFKNSKSGGGLSDDANLVLKLGNVAIIEALKNSVAFSHRYGNSTTPYRIIRSGRDTLDKAFYTEFLMNNRAFLQIGSGDLSDGMPTPPGEESGINNTNSYMRLFYPNGKQLLFYGPGPSSGTLGKTTFYTSNGIPVFSFYSSSGSGTLWGTLEIGVDDEDRKIYVNCCRQIYFCSNLGGTIGIGNRGSNIAHHTIIIGNGNSEVRFQFGDTQTNIKADYKQVTTSGSVKKAFKTYYYEYSGTYDAANPQFALYKSQMGSPFTTLDIAGRCRHMHATIKFTNSSNNLNIFNLCDKCYICNSSGDVWVNLNDVTYQMTDGTAYTIFFQFEIEES